MKREFKVGDLVRCVHDSWKDGYFLGKIGKIIDIRKFHPPYTVEFFEPIKGGHDGWGAGKDGNCWNFDEEDVKLYKEPILKIFLKEKKNEL